MVSRGRLIKLAEGWLDTFIVGVEILSRDLAAYFQYELDLDISANKAAGILDRCSNVESRQLDIQEHHKDKARKKWRVVE